MWSCDKENLDLTQNLVHPTLETVDPTPNIHTLFAKFNYKFFQGKLSAVELEWSKRMYQCAGICYSRRSRLGMACVIRLSEPLLKLRSRKELIETLLHEMIHAYCFVLNIREGNGGHGPNFLKIAAGINRQTGTNITVYHNFTDEVDFYKKHWWRCDGPCQSRRPYFGIVKRVSNRAPGPNDFWWGEHSRTCGGKFIKVKEPTPEPKAKRRKGLTSTQSNQMTNYVSVIKSPPPTSSSSSSVPSKGKTSPLSSPTTSKDIREFFKKPQIVPETGNIHGFGSPSIPKRKNPLPSSPTSETGNIHGFGGSITKKKTSPSTSGPGHTLGGSDKKRSRLLDEFPLIPQNTSMHDEISQSNPNHEIILLDADFDDDFATSDNESDSSINPTVEATFIESPEISSSSSSAHQTECPICSERVFVNIIENHIDACLLNFAYDEEVGDPLPEEDNSLGESTLTEENQTEVETTSTEPIQAGASEEQSENQTESQRSDDSCILIESHIECIEVLDSPSVPPPAPAEPIVPKYPCPNCPKMFSEGEINAHLDTCLS